MSFDWSLFDIEVRTIQNLINFLNTFKKNFAQYIIEKMVKNCLKILFTNSTNDNKTVIVVKYHKTDNISLNMSQLKKKFKWQC